MYIGNDLQVAFPSYRIIDDISGSFNGSLKTFPLNVGGAAPVPFPINPQQCLISVNGVIQKPDPSGAAGFNLVGTNIVFASAPTGGWAFFGVVLAGADYVNVGANFPAGTAAAPSITFDASTGTGLYLASSNVLGFSTGGTQRLTIDSSGNLSGTGTSTAASFIPSSSTAPTNGVYLPAANTVAISTGGSGRLFVDASGRVGMGAAEGTYAASVTTTGNNGFLVKTGTASAVQIYAGNTGGEAALGTLSSDPLNIITAGSSRIRITSAGLVGVGTSSPSNLFHVSGTSGTPAVFERTSATGTFIALKDSASQTFIGNTNGVFSIQTPGSSYSDKLVVTSVGTVGIGTTTPSTYGAQLAVIGGSVHADRNIGGAAAQVQFSMGASSGANFGQIGNTGTRWSLGYGTTANTIGTEVLVWNSSGNVGIGSTPSYSFHVTNSSNAVIACTNPTDSATGVLNAAGGGTINVGTASNHPLTVSINSTEALRVDTSRRLLVGTSSTSAQTRALFQGNSAGTQTAEVFLAADTNAPGGGLGNIYFSDNSHSKAAIIAAVRDGGTWTSGSSQPTSLQFYTTADGASSPTERMRISQNGTTLITANNSSYSIGNGGNTIAGVGINSGSGYNWIAITDSNYVQRCDNTNGNVFNFLRGSTTVGSISVTATATAYNTSSDYRLKENVKPVSDGIIRLQQLKPSRFNFIEEPDKTVDGFIAHEVQATVPEAITGEKDAVDEDGNPIYQGIDQSKLVPLLTAALQEAVAKIESLEARLTAAGI